MDNEFEAINTQGSIAFTEIVLELNKYLNNDINFKRK